MNIPVGGGLADAAVVGQAVHGCGIHQPTKHQDCLSLAGGGALVAAVIAGQGGGYQASSRSCRQYGLECQARSGRLACGKGLSRWFLVNG